MELVLFATNAIVIYMLAAWAVRVLEKRRGKILAQRQVIFFLIFLTLALISFSVIEALLSTG